MARCIAVIVSLVLLTAQALPVGRVSAGIAGAERRAGGAASVLPGWASAEGHTPPPPDALTPAVARSLADAQPDDLVPVILVLHEQAAPDELAPALGPRSAAHVRLVLELQAVADRTQGPLRAYLEGARAAETVERVTPLWIFNGVALWARPAVVRLLASHPAVAAVHLDQQRQWIDPQVEAVGVTAAATPSTAWGVTRIGAPQVWASLGISGTGAVVAGMDTGVDWLHPALQLNYRGYNPHGAHNHVGNWFDAVGGGLYPFDNHGHGTHTMGTAVGRQGIGVAPGATWIGVKVLDGSGMGYDSWIHAGFQWLLAPGGDPAKAPDVVDCSWGNSISYLTTFQQDLRVLRASGILPVFSNGNDGPGSGTVNSPASLPEAFAVGATDQYDEVGAFSSRGPSPAPWFQIRPHVSAPGVAVRSALPGGTVGDMSGTSMAAPHVAGTVALLRSVEPTLSITSAMFLITSTAQALGSYSPNNDSGWGRLDAFEAVSVLAAPGHLSGRVVQTGRAAPIAEAQLLAVLEDSGHSVKTATDEDGFYQLSLAPGRYSVTASAFGYISDTVFGVDVTHGAITSLDFSLASLPTGTLRVRVTDADAAEITATVTVVGTPLHGVFNERDFAVPAGVYTVRGSRLGYRVVTTTTEVTVGSTTTVDLELPSAPTILLIDSGPWYYGSEAGYYRQALDDLAYVYDEQSIRLLASDIPTASGLAPYDMVIWSAPWDAPGYIGAEDALVDYLSNGGRLLLSGQDVGYLDSGYSSYFHEYLKAQLVDDTANVWVLHGTPGDLFDGMEITITGSGGADNQVYPDEVAVTDPDVAAPVWTYEGRGCGGLRVGTCLDYRAVYLAFGFEAINDEQARQEVMRRAVEWLWTPPPTVALELTPTASLRVGAAGTVVTHTLQLRHLGERGVTDTFTLSAEGYAWDVQMEPASLTLTPCAAASLVVSVTIP
ncbi:MAG: S8 family serine peptidase, partial [Anaerolineales bacterium]|nr:S8 family serine peptidase [Anaerolineales bacterium]